LGNEEEKIFGTIGEADEEGTSRQYTPLDSKSPVGFTESNVG